ncbi:hypothetical protein MRX96_054052 [Rhipicephalus microplus]
MPTTSPTNPYNTSLSRDERAKTNHMGPGRRASRHARMSAAEKTGTRALRRLLCFERTNRTPFEARHSSCNLSAARPGRGDSVFNGSLQTHRRRLGDLSTPNPAKTASGLPNGFYSG